MATQLDEEIIDWPTFGLANHPDLELVDSYTLTLELDSAHTQHDFYDVLVAMIISDHRIVVIVLIPPIEDM